MDSINDYCLHVHALDGAVKKDGPSAGCAIALAFISVVLDKKIRSDISITGELGPYGEVKKIGGLYQKLSGAKLEGVRDAYIPLENEDDLNKILKEDDKFISGDFKVHCVSKLTDFMDEIFINGNKKRKL